MQQIRFGEDYELDLGAYELRHAGEPLKLERIPMEILRFLIEQRGQLITREQIAERAWGKGVHLDIDNSINGAIRKIRQVLKDDIEHPHYIQTVTGRGYRFIATVRDDPALAPSAAPAVARPDRRWWRVTALVAVAVAAGVLVWWRARAAHAPTERVMLAVLPFQNLTGDSAQEYLSDGLTEEMITQLGSRDPQHLGVIARTSVMQYKGGGKPLDQIERDLGVQYVLEGSIRRDANDVRITAQLIQARDQSQLWARQYDRKPQSLLVLQGEIAQEIADELESRLGGRATASAIAGTRSTTLEAYDLYLRGEFLYNKRGITDLEGAIRFFLAATQKDSGYARAFASLANAYSLLAGYSQAPPERFVVKARAAALRALALDNSLAEAHTALALIVQNWDWDWQTAEREYQQAIALNPNYATAHHWYAEHLMWRGRFAEALQESERARQLDPLSLIIAADNGAILLYSRQYDRAIAKFRSVLAIDPDFPRGHLIEAAYIEKGMYAEALADVERMDIDSASPWYWAVRAAIYGRWGRPALAHHALQEMFRTNRYHPLQAAVIGGAYLGVGNKAQALTWLERGYGDHSSDLVSLKVNPYYDPLRSDPRFQRLLERVGLTP